MPEGQGKPQNTRLPATLSLARLAGKKLRKKNPAPQEKYI